MPNTNSFKEKSRNGLPPHNSRIASILNSPVTVGILAFTIFAILFSTLIYQRYLILKQTQKKDAYDVANTAKNKLQESLAYSASATKMLSLFIDHNGAVKNFDSVAAEILAANKDIDALELVPNGVIRYVYPRQGNESVLGYDILNDPARNKEAFKAIEKKELFFSGPYELKQGGFGIVGRLPVFRNEKFWGFSAVVVKMSTLLQSAGIDATPKNGYYFQLSKISPTTKKEEFFIQHGKESPRDYLISINLPNGDWKLSVEPAGGYKGLANVSLLALMGFLFSVMGGVFVFIIVGRPEELNKLVRQRTRQLKESEENYKALFEKSPLPIWIYDLESFKFLEVNDAAVNLYGYSREEFLKMSLTDIRHKEDVDKFIASVREGTGELREAGVWTHIKKSGEDIQMLIFSRNIFYKGKQGRLVLLMDVSEKIKVENELVRSEEKYRSLIEQASDGIILYSFDGIIHSFNKAAYTQTGYSEEEFEKLNLKDLFFEQGIASNKPKDKKINIDSPTTLYRKLKRKDGSVFIVELNARMLADGKILAIVRDITERENAERARLREEETRQLIMNSALDAIVSINSDGAITLWNPQAERIFGWSEDEILGKLLSETIIPKTYRQLHEKGMKRYLEEGEGHMLNKLIGITALKRDGSEFPIELSIIPMKQDGQQSFCAFIRDITERKNAEKEINKSNERFELIAEATNDAVWDHDLVKDETWGNRKLYSIYGFDYGKEIINLKMFLSRIHPDERDGIEERMQKAMEQKVTSISEEFRFKTGNGEYRTFYDRAYIKYDPEGNPIRFLGAMHDITERESIKQQIIKEKELSDSIINSLPGIFYLYNKEGRFLRWNKNFESVTGYDGKEIARMHPLEFFEKKDHALITAKIENVFVAGDDYVEADLLLKDKQTIPYYFTGQAIDYEGEPCLMGVGLDFSEKEKARQAILQSEAKYKELIEQASDGIFISDTQGKYIEVNTRACLMLGYTKEELLTMSGADILFNPGDVNTLPKRYDELKTGSSYIVQTTLRKKDGSLLAVESNSKMLPDGRFIGIVRDVEERKKSEKALRESEERYRALVENAPEALVVMDMEKQVFMSVSESATKLFGMSREDLLKVGPVAVSPEYQPDGKLSSVAAKEYLQRAINGEKPVFEWTHCDSKGNSIPCEIWLVRLPSENAVLVRGSIVDITERKKIAEKIYQSEQKYRLLFYNNPLPMWMTTIPGLDIIDVNESAIRQYGYSREEFLKLNARDMRPAEDVESFVSEVAKMEPGMNNIRSWRHKKKDGTIINVEIYSHEVFYEGRRVWLGLSHDVTEKYKAKELLQKSYEDIRQLASNLQSIREDERTNIAREIHDELGQQLTGLKMDMHWLSRKIKTEDDEVNRKMKESIQLINATITSVRKIATDLRPSILDDLGLLAALEWQSDEFEKRSGTKVEFFNNAGDISVTPEVATALFRMYQELLTNIARHANANLVTASLYTDNDRLCFSIADNGSGFNIDTINKKKTLGLLGIKERTLLMGGTYEIKTRPGEGAEITISVPLVPEKA